MPKKTTPPAKKAPASKTSKVTKATKPAAKSTKAVAKASGAKAPAKKAAAPPKKATPVKKASAVTKKAAAAKKPALKKAVATAKEPAVASSTATKKASGSKKTVANKKMPTAPPPVITTLPQPTEESRSISVAEISKPKAKNPTTTPDTKGKVRNILISQPFPENGKSPLVDIGTKYKIKVDFRSFIQVEGLSVKDFRRSRINIPEYTAIIFNSRNAIDYFFKLSDEMRIKLSQDMKYFCVSEAIALYLQKYIQYRKRKVFFETPSKTLFEILNKHKDNEKFLYPCSKDRKDDIPNFLASKRFNYSEAYIYQTVPSDLSDLTSIKYDMIVFFSPVSIKSLFFNFPDFEQEDRRIGGFGQVTHDAIKEAGLRLDLVAPSPQAPSMAQAIENYFKMIGMK